MDPIDNAGAEDQPPQKRRRVESGQQSPQKNEIPETPPATGLQSPQQSLQSLPDYFDSDNDSDSEAEVDRPKGADEDEEYNSIPEPLRPLIENLKSRQKKLVASLRNLLSGPQEQRQLASMSALSPTLSGAKKNKTIAIIGESGKGKSSLVNALLNTTVAPTSMGNSCTTVPTHFVYSPPGDTQYRAVIEYLSRQEAEAEVTEWISHIKTQHSIVKIGDTEGAQTTQDPRDSLEEEANIAKDCIRALGYTGNFEDNDLSPFAVYTSALYDFNPILKSLEEFQLIITAEDEEAFTEQIREFLKHDSSGGGSEVQLWPLLKSVRIYLDSLLLQDGITLIDLPGYNDQNAARSTIAQRFISRSDVDEIIVVAAYERIFSNALLLPVLNMGIQSQVEFEGGKRLIIACTKVDQLMTLPSNELHTELFNVPGFREQLETLKQQKIEARKTRGKVADVEESIQKLMSENLAKLPTAIEDSLLSQLKEHCPNINNDQITFKVFMTSARDYLKESDKSSEKAKDTGVPSFVSFLSKIAVEKHAISFKQLLGEFQRQILMLQCSLANSEIWLSEETRIVLKEGIELSIEELGIRIDDALRHTGEEFDRHLDEFEDFLRDTVAGARDGAIEVHRKCLQTNSTKHNTYHCICVKKGEKFQGVCIGKPAPIYELNKLFASIIFENVKLKFRWKNLWNDLRNCVSKYETDAIEGLDNFLEAILKIFHGGGVDTAAIELFIGSAIKSISNTAHKCNKRIRHYRKKASEIIRSEQEIKKGMKASYEEAASYSRRNKFQFQRQIIEDGLRHTEAFEKIEATLIYEVHKVRDRCYRMLKRTMKRVLADVENMVTAMYNRSHKDIVSGKEQRDIAKGILAEAFDACRKDEDDINELIASLRTF